MVKTGGRFKTFPSLTLNEVISGRYGRDERVRVRTVSAEGQAYTSTRWDGRASSWVGAQRGSKVEV